MRHTVHRCIFDRYPRLAEWLNVVELARLPTPVDELPELARRLDAGRLFVKRDDLTADPYGGNKVRKLEFLLGKAYVDGAKSVMTFGGAGSNHALATAMYSRRLGMWPIAMLVPQPKEACVRRNLLLHLTVDTDLHLYPDKPRLKAGVTWQRTRRRLEDGVDLAVFPAGGSSALGATGYVNAALELAAQVDAGLLPCPDRVYVACGTMGTCVGLALGFALAGLNTRVEAVRVTEPDMASEARARQLFSETVAFLHSLDPSVPAPRYSRRRLVLRHEFFGEGYGIHLPRDLEAADRFRAAAGVPLEGTYTGKAFAALLSDAATGRLRGETVLFWDTYDSHDWDAAIRGLDYHRLPEEFHDYFEEP
jgi:D-cysteine desulfhydrase